MNIQKHFDFANKQGKEGHFFKDKAWPPIKSLIEEVSRSDEELKSASPISTTLFEEATGTFTILLAPVSIPAGILYGAVGKAGAYLVNLAKGPN